LTFLPYPIQRIEYRRKQYLLQSQLVNFATRNIAARIRRTIVQYNFNMGFLDNLKEKSKKLAAAIRDDEPVDSAAAPVVMEWDKIYVEIDNDANLTVANESRSPTQRRFNRQRRPISVLESQTICNESRASSTFETRSYGMMENGGDDETNVTPSFSNVNTFTSGGFTRTASYGSEEAPTIDNSHVETLSITKNGKYLANNHFANAQLMRWKYAAEEGTCLIQNMVSLASIAAIYTTVYPLVIFDYHWSIPSGICAFHTIILCLLIITFEIRVWGTRNPESLRARVSNVLVRHMKILGMVWGRGFLFIFAGSMNITMEYYPYNYATGGLLIALGLISVFMGAHAAFNLERLRLSLTDHSYLWNKFVKSDSDEDNLIGIEDFSILLWSLGLELDDSYTCRAFREIDRDRDGLINFYEFKFWWIASQDDDGTIVTMDMSKTSFKKVPDQISTQSGDSRSLRS
jgi:hypothetical protein